jgi:hypothetical protein
MSMSSDPVYLHSDPMSSDPICFDMPLTNSEIENHKRWAKEEEEAAQIYAYNIRQLERIHKSESMTESDTDLVNKDDFQ